MEAVDLIADQVRRCESARMKFLCCPEAVLGDLAEYASAPSEVAFDAREGELETGLSPLDAVACSIEKVHEAGFQGVLRAHHHQPVILDALLQQL